MNIMQSLYHVEPASTMEVGVVMVLAAITAAFYFVKSLKARRVGGNVHASVAQGSTVELIMLAAMFVAACWAGIYTIFW